MSIQSGGLTDFGEVVSAWRQGQLRDDQVSSLLTAAEARQTKDREAANFAKRDEVEALKLGILTGGKSAADVWAARNAGKIDNGDVATLLEYGQSKARQADERTEKDTAGKLDLGIERGEIRDVGPIEAAHQAGQISDERTAVLLRRLHEKTKADTKGAATVAAFDKRMGQDGWLMPSGTMTSSPELPGRALDVARSANSMPVQPAEGFNQFDPADRRGANTYLENIKTAIGKADRPDDEKSVMEWAAVKGLVARTGFVPDDVARDFRAGLASDDPRQVGATLARINEILKLPGGSHAFDGADGGGKLRDEGEIYAANVKLFGSEEKATENYIIRHSPDFRKNEEGIKKAADKLASAATPSDVSWSVDGGGFARMWRMISFQGTADMPPSELAKPIMADYRALLRGYYDKTQDADVAKELAGKRIAELYGATSIVGDGRTVMRNPPETAYPPDQITGGHKYVRAQLLDFVKQQTGMDLKPGQIYLRPFDKRDGEPQTYHVFYKDENGLLQGPVSQDRWYAQPGIGRLAARDKVLAEGERFRSLVEQFRANPNLLPSVPDSSWMGSKVGAAADDPVARQAWQSAKDSKTPEEAKAAEDTKAKMLQGAAGVFAPSPSQSAPDRPTILQVPPDTSGKAKRKPSTKPSTNPFTLPPMPGAKPEDF